MMNKECNIALETLQSKKSKQSPEDVIETICEQDYVDGSSDRLYENSRHAADSTVAVECEIFRPKSPPRPHANPKLSRGRPYNKWKPIDSIRKSRSSALPSANELSSARTNRQTRGESASTPELVDNGGSKDRDLQDEEYRNYRKQVIRLNRAAICYDNIRWICVFLNFVILILSFLYFGSAVAFIYSKDILLLVMKDYVYSFLILFFLAVSVLYWLISLSGLYLLWKAPRKVKTHAVLTLIFGLATASLIFLQNSTETSIKENLESQLVASITFRNQKSYEKAWDYIHNTFKCCGVTGFLDWCYQENFYSKIRETKTDGFFGSDECSLPDSCCKNYESERDNTSNCIELLNTKQMRNSGCIIFIKKEIHHLGKMYRVITICAVGALTLLTAMSASLYTFFLK